MEGGCLVKTRVLWMPSLSISHVCVGDSRLRSPSVTLIHACHVQGRTVRLECLAVRPFQPGGLHREGRECCSRRGTARAARAAKANAAKAAKAGGARSGVRGEATEAGRVTMEACDDGNVEEWGCQEPGKINSVRSLQRERNGEDMSR